MKIALTYFSATGNTGKMADVINESLLALGAQVDIYDITSYADRQKPIDLASYDAVVFGSPIHSWRAPRVVRKWMRTLDGQGKKCSMFFTYGGFGVHPTHYSTRQILTEQNFAVVSSAEFPGAHTFNLGGWKALENRPDKSDFAVAKEYAAKTYKRFIGEDSSILGELEKTKYREEELDQIETFRFRILTQLPTRNGQGCGMCMICEESCPTGAISAETGEVNKDKCIACLRCVDTCPEDALKINDMSETYAFKLEMEKATNEDLEKKQSKIYL
ncbi:MAG: 4Fe-4S binding protein [Desulfobacteraceae bacterium]|nr:4Fe-4S binding protein [Desulfobacteraceae bacterium]MBC2755391.1 4Fe-4S binding protein [Desulfobacteraceae bacterium]